MLALATTTAEHIPLCRTSKELLLQAFCVIETVSLLIFRLSVGFPLQAKNSSFALSFTSENSPSTLSIYANTVGFSTFVALAIFGASALHRGCHTRKANPKHKQFPSTTY